MKKNLFKLLIISLIFSSCVSIPKETITLSNSLGNDLKVLHSAHRNILKLYYDKIEADITTFIDEVYSPFVIHYVLKVEYKAYKEGKPSLYGSIENAAKVEGKKETDEALKTMLDFQQAANAQINAKKNELLEPILAQETELLNQIDQSYRNAIYANSTITGYLKSVYKVKETQKEALSLIGLEGADDKVAQSLMQVSKLVNNAVDEGKKIDFKSDNAYKKINDIANKIKTLTNNK